MSLFTTKDWWSASIDSDEEFDKGCMCVANVDNEPQRPNDTSGNDKIITGSFSGKYSKRHRSNVAVIIDRIVFISSFLFYCLLLNHSFQTNPNRITNCFKLILFYLQLYKLHLLNAFVYF